MTPKSIDSELAALLRLGDEPPAKLLAALNRLSQSEQVALVCRAPARQREEILRLLPHPETVVPALPEVEFCCTARAIGLADAHWLLSLASPEQIIAAVDIDAWQGSEPDLVKLDEWIHALGRAGDASLLRVATTLDTELIYLYLRSRIEVELKPADGESNDDWQPRDGAQTLEGQFYYRARSEKDELEILTRMLTLLFSEDYWMYFRLMQAVIHELPSENEEFALRWRNGRLADLGFPPWEEAMAVYGYLPPEARTQLPTAETNALDVAPWHLPVAAPSLPVDNEQSEYLLFRAASKLSPEERSTFFYAFLALANHIAVADRLPLGDEETLPNCIAKAAEVASIGLEKLRAAHPLSEENLLRRVPVGHLFRIGINERRDGA